MVPAPMMATARGRARAGVASSGLAKAVLMIHPLYAVYNELSRIAGDRTIAPEVRRQNGYLPLQALRPVATISHKARASIAVVIDRAAEQGRAWHSRNNKHGRKSTAC
jgi:hypothetical protein